MKLKTDILKQIKDKKYKPVYLLHGEEDYNIDILTQTFENKVLSDSEKSFNMTIWYGKDATAKQVIDSCMRYPMMSPFQLIILKEAQDMKSLNDLKSYLNNPVPSTVFVIQYKQGTIDMRKAIGKAIKQKGEIYLSKKLYDNEIPKWISSYVSDKGYDIDDQSTLLIADHLGAELAKIANELDKLFILIPKGSIIDSKIIEKHIGISRKYNVFELQDAMASRDMFKAQQIINYFADNPKKNPIVVVIAQTFNFFSKLYLAISYRNQDDTSLAKSLGFSPRNEYSARFFVRNYRKALSSYTREEIENAIAIISKFDLKSKGVNNASMDGGQLLKEMIYELVVPKSLA